jgi:hypothetical protein
MLKFLAGVISLCVVCGSLNLWSSADARTVDYRWTSGYNMGTSESGVLATDGSTRFLIYCADGQTPQDTGIEVFTTKGASVVKGSVVAQVTVGDTTFQTTLNQGVSVEQTRAGKSDLLNLVTALGSAKTGYFTVSIPQINWSKDFSVLGAKAKLYVLLNANKSVSTIDACLQ